MNKNIVVNKHKIGSESVFDTIQKNLDLFALINVSMANDYITN